MGNTSTLLAESALSKTSFLARRRFLLGIAVLLLIITVGYIGICWYVADRLSVPTRVALTGAPADYNLPYEDIQFQSALDGIPLRGWFINSPGTKAILIVHGNGGIRNDPTIGLMDIGVGLANEGYDVLMFDLRAHGESGGTRYSLGQWETRDVAGALTYLKSRNATAIGVLGISLGGGTTLLAAPDHPEMKAIVADTSFSDLPMLVDGLFTRQSGLPDFFKPGLLFMAQTVYGIDVSSTRPERAMASLQNRPVFLIHSELDDFIPILHATRLQQAGKENPNLRVWITSSAGHAQSFKDQQKGYLQRIVLFFKEFL